MNRRLFAGQLAAGLAVQLISAPLIAESLPISSVNQRSTSILLDKATELVRNGLIGTPQRLCISHSYSPERTPLHALVTMAQQDIDRAGHLIGLDLKIDVQTLFADSSSATFGSYSARFDRAALTVIWQSLARVGSQANAPVRILRLSGSKGILQTAADGLNYEFVDLRGRIVRVERQIGSAAAPLTRRGFLGA